MITDALDRFIDTIELKVLSINHYLDFCDYDPELMTEYVQAFNARSDHLIVTGLTLPYTAEIIWSDHDCQAAEHTSLQEPATKFFSHSDDYLLMVVPLFDRNGHCTGYLHCLVSLDYMRSFLRPVPLNTDLGLWIIDANGEQVLGTNTRAANTLFEAQLLEQIDVSQGGLQRISHLDAITNRNHYFATAGPGGAGAIVSAINHVNYLNRVISPGLGSELVIGLLVMMFAGLVWQHVRYMKLKTTWALNLEGLQQLESISTMGKMAAALAHEVKNPITVIDGYLHLLKAFPERYANTRTLELVKRELKRIMIILNEYLALGRQPDSAVAQVDVNEILVDIVSLMDLYTYKDNVTLYSDLEPVPRLMVDADKLRQVFVNLLKNAIESIEDGGTVTVASRRSEDGGLLVTITDTGSGIDPSNLPRLGTPFFTTKDTGTGLGLAVSYKYIHELGGKIQVRSQLGRGTTFKIYLPGDE